MDGNFPNNNNPPQVHALGGPPHPEATPTDQLPGNRTPSPPLIQDENLVNVPAPPPMQLDEGGPPIPEATQIHSLPGNRTTPPTSQNENLGNEIIHNVAARGLEVIMNMIAGKNNE